VVDRRDDPDAFPLGANRALSSLASAPVQVESRDIAESGLSDHGIYCVISTPGPRALLSMLLQRVWGIMI
jgi:hypothetical protein